MLVKNLYRFPVKGLSGEPLMQVSLIENYGFPGDRNFALALPNTEFNELDPKPVPKGKFLMLMKNERLANLRSRYDEQLGELVIADARGKELIKASIADAEGRAEVETFFFDYMRGYLTGPPRLVESKGHQFTDVSVFSKDMMHAISLINLASVRELEKELSTPIHPLRFRANVYYDSKEPWSEFDLLGKTITVGEAPVEVVQRTRRCPATQVNPDTAQRDIDIPAMLNELYGHRDIGVYAQARGRGIINIGDTVNI